MVSEIDHVASQLVERAEALPDSLTHRRSFAMAYSRMTRAVGEAVDAGRFEDPGWVTAWDVRYAQLYMQALEADRNGEQLSRPWQLTFAAAEDLSAVRHLLLALNAHVNYDLPQALLDVISDADFGDPTLLARRQRDYERIDEVLAARVAAEDAAIGSGGTRFDRVLEPLNRLAARRVLPKLRRKVWTNTAQLQRARAIGQDRYAVRLAELEVVTAARTIDLLEPGQVLLRLAFTGFGVSLPPD